MGTVVTGAFGFIGMNLVARLKPPVSLVGSKTAFHTMEEGLKTADVVYHLAGANRPDSVSDFEKVNVNLTKDICNILLSNSRSPRIIFASSIQAEQDNSYGRSKRRAEEALQGFAAKSGADVRIYRLRNVFGPGCKPNYNSVVATFCHNVAHGIPLKIDDPSRVVELVFVDAVVNAFLKLTPPQDIPYTKITVVELAESIKNAKQGLVGSTRFEHQLYYTYLSYVGEGV